MNVQKAALRTIIYAVLIIGGLIIAFPVYLTLITAFKTPHESAVNFFSFPHQFFLGNFQSVLSSSNFLTYVVNSVVITVVSVGVIVLFTPMVSYAISRNMSKLYYRLLYVVIVAGIFVPFQVIMLPIVKQMTRLHLLSQGGLIILYVTYSLIQGVFLCVGYLKSIPLELEEAAYIDGCGVVACFFRVIYPLMKPITVTVLILNTLWIWNDFLLPLLILNRSSEFWTLPLFQYNFKSQYSFDYNIAFASFLFSIVPIMILYVFVQKYIINGLTEGSLKG